MVLKLGGGAVLRKNSWVNTETQHRIAFSLLRNYDWWKTEKKLVLTPESYKVLTNFVGFRAENVIAGPSGTSEPEAGPAATQTATPPMTPQIRPAVVHEPAPEPAMAHDSDSDTTIVAEDYWEAEMRHVRDQVFNQQSTISREGNSSNPSVFMGAHRASYATAASEQNRQRTHRPASPNLPTAPSRSSLHRAMESYHNDRSSLQTLLRAQTQATAPSPQTKSHVSVPETRTGYQTMPSSSRSPQIDYPRAEGQTRSQIQDPLIAAATSRARATAELPMLERKRPWHTWFSQLGLPFRVDFVFFGTSSVHAQARVRAYAQDISIARALAGLGPDPDTERVWRGRRLHTGLTRAQRRALEAGVDAGPAYEYARIAPSEGQGKGDGRLSMLAKGVLVFVILLVQATLLAAIVWSFFHFGADNAVAEWVARAAGKVIGAWEAFVYGFWVAVDFIVNLVIGLLYVAFILLCLAYCCGG